MSNENEVAVESKALKLADVKRGWYTSAQLAIANEAAQQAVDAAQAASGEVKFNFDPQAEFPAGYGLAIIPLAQRNAEKKVMENYGVCIAAIPDIATLTKDAEGKAWADDSIYASLVAKVANTARGESATLPFAVADFITSNRPEGILVAFNTLVGDYVSQLKQKGLKLMTKETLRAVLCSSATAKQQFPKVGQDKWLAIINSMIKHAEEKGLAVGILTEWRDNRENAGLPMVEDFDLDGML